MVLYELQQNKKEGSENIRDPISILSYSTIMSSAM